MILLFRYALLGRNGGTGGCLPWLTFAPAFATIVDRQAPSLSQESRVVYILHCEVFVFDRLYLGENTINIFDFLKYALRT